MGANKRGGRNAPTIKDFFDRLLPLVEQDREIAARLRDLMSEMREVGVNGALLKKWAKAEIADYSDPDRKATQRLLDGTEDAVLYARSLGHDVASAAPETKQFVVHVDRETGEIIEPAAAPPLAAVTAGEAPALPADSQPQAASPAEPTKPAAVAPCPAAEAGEESKAGSRISSPAPIPAAPPVYPDEPIDLTLPEFLRRVPRQEAAA